MHHVDHIVGDDQMRRRIDRRLDVVTHEACALAVCCHRSRVRIGQRYLAVRRVLKTGGDPLQALHFLADPGQLLLQALDLAQFYFGLLLPVSAIHFLKMTGRALFEVTDPKLDLPGREIPIPID